MLAEINFNLTDSQRDACEFANASYHKVSLEDHGTEPSRDEVYAALMAAWHFIGEINQDWVY